MSESELTLDPPGIVYASVEAFYDANELRRRSPEWDYGVHWQPETSHWPVWRVSWVVETGELYTVCTSDGRLVVLGVCEKVGEYPYGQHSRDWAAFNDEQLVEMVMKGWAEVTPPKLSWVTARLRQFEGVARPAV